MTRQLALGLDTSTQSLTAIVIDIDSTEVVYQYSLNYLVDARLGTFGIDEDFLLPPESPGEANQPALLYLASLDAILTDMQTQWTDQGLSMRDIAVINVSGQQHGHVLLNRQAQRLFQELNMFGHAPEAGLADILSGAFALPFARIWRTAHTGEQADHVRRAVGGSKRMIELTGSDAPLRFSAFGIRKTGQDLPEAYHDTRFIHQISSLIPALLTGNVNIPLDFGNACGTGLMAYTKKAWSPTLIRAVAEGLPDGAAGLRIKLPSLNSAKTLVGNIAAYFVNKYDLSPNCAVGIGSGDNPQTKALVNGSMLSLGSSFVIMVETDGKTLDQQGFANAMYDGFDRPFMFGCRTNGALQWDNVRGNHGIDRKDYLASEAALTETPCGNRGRLFLWQEEKESFPVCDTFDPVRIGYDKSDFAIDYAGIIESSLASVYLHSLSFMVPDEALYVAGGPTQSPEIMRRVAAIWNRNVCAIEDTGAALGAAVPGAYALHQTRSEPTDPAQFTTPYLRQSRPIPPVPKDVQAYHGPKGYLKQFQSAEARWL